MNISKDEGKLNSKPKWKIVRSGKPLEPFIPPTKDLPCNPYSLQCLCQDPKIDPRNRCSHVKIPEIDVAILAMPIHAIPIQSIALLSQVTNEIKEYFKSSPAEICRKNKLPIGVYEPSTRKQMRLDESQGICFPNNDTAESTPKAHAPSLVSYLPCPLRASQRGVSIFNANAVIKEVDKNVAWVLD
ncbi:hypothetical protein Cgig2_027782 [Carnegiea gigantea]|uniref:Uncharacterized protein n=1 Tax=Carnegiea gigantea TaxID=171969 RepID=A0A9Q1JKH4_9CARY|nr:hypothetical protein Cgig2_027782 [Carnegiea gigantea]